MFLKTLFMLIIVFFSLNTYSRTSEQQMTNLPLQSMTEPYRYVIDFIDDNESMLWRSTNDGVMGGMSQGGLMVSNGISRFAGNISIENNGGFSSIYRNVEQLPQGLDTIEINVAGDGLMYQFRVMVYINGYRLAYKHNFETIYGEKRRVSLKLSDFKATFRGRIISDAPKLTSENIRQVGFLVTNKQPGAFSLSLFKVDIYHQQEA